MYAIIESGGKQYRVSTGDKINVEKLAIEAGNKIELARVLMVADGENVQFGTPVVEGAQVTATVLAHGRGKKVIIYKHKRNYHKKQGHRQSYTTLHIDEITA